MVYDNLIVYNSLMVYDNLVEDFSADGCHRPGAEEGEELLLPF